jgi:hypothetical protein
MLGNHGFVHQDVAANQVHAEEGADALDSGDVGIVVLSTPGFMPTTGNSAPAKNAAAMHYEVGDATIENMAASDPHRVSRGLSSPTNLGGFGEDGSSDVDEPAVDVGACKAPDHFVVDETDEAEEAVKGENRGRGGEGERGRRGEGEGGTWGVSRTRPPTRRPVWTCWTRRQMARRRGSTACIFARPH